MVFGVSIDMSALQTRYSVTQKLQDIVKRGLGDRVISVEVWSMRTVAWSINASQSKRKIQFWIGLVLVSVNLSRSVDRGRQQKTRKARQQSVNFGATKQNCGGSRMER